MNTATTITPALWARGIIAAIVALILNLIIFFIGTSAGASMEMTSPQPMTIGVPAVIGASLAPLIIAGIVTGLLANKWSKARIVLTWVGLALAVVSCAATFAAPDLATGLSLAGMHIVTGIAWVLAMTLGIRKNA